MDVFLQLVRGTKGRPYFTTRNRKALFKRDSPLSLRSVAFLCFALLFSSASSRRAPLFLGRSLFHEDAARRGVRLPRGSFTCLPRNLYLRSTARRPAATVHVYYAEQITTDSIVSVRAFVRRHPTASHVPRRLRHLPYARCIRHASLLFTSPAVEQRFLKSSDFLRHPARYGRSSTGLHNRPIVFNDVRL